MKYTVHDDDGDAVSFVVDDDRRVEVSFEGSGYLRIFGLEEFKDFRRAVGYVWQEVHSDGE